MGLFGRKKPERNEDYSDIKRVKDLNPDDAPKRREIVKPWGSKERMAVLIVLLLTVGISGGLALSTRSFKLPGLPRLSKPEFNLFNGEQTIVITGNGEAKKVGEESVEYFRSATKDLTGVYGFLIIRLSESESYGLYENEVFQAASLVKLPAMIAMYQEAEAGRIDLEEKYSLKDEDRLTGSGNLSSKPVGYKISYRELIHLMGRDSDNTAFRIVRNKLTDKKINDFIKEAGLKGTSLKDNNTTPSDVGILFQELWNNKFISKENSTELLSYLTDTIYEDWLGKGVPNTIRVAHKYGREVGVVNDGGIIYSDDPFVLVIMTKGVLEKEADMIIPDLAKNLFDLETK